MQRWKSTVSIIIATSITLIALTALLYKQYKPSSHKGLFNVSNSKQNGKKLSSSLAWKKVIVKEGDTLTSLFNRLKINSVDLYQILKEQELPVLRPKQNLYFQINSSHQLVALKFPLSIAKTINIIRKGEHFSKKICNKPIFTTLAYKTFTIHHSFIEDVKKTKITNQMLSDLQEIFRGKINFSSNLHPGDRFDILYEEQYVDKKKYQNGNIIAAEFTHGRKINQAIRYTYPSHHTAYYTPDGRSIGALFLQAPLHYKRISSPFSYHRWDPILHQIRPHFGIDFAANRGTPIKSIGEGRVSFVGNISGYGKTIKIRYGEHYAALYGHMSRFAKIKLNQWVHKGQIIGYVGDSGWATGPHLHFGFYVDGKPCNWLTMRSLKAEFIPPSHQKQFFETARKLLTKLHLHQQTHLAENNSS